MTGMLWFDNDPKTSLEDKIKKAAGYYSEKYHKNADLCFVHPTMMPEDGVSVDGIRVIESKHVRPNHFHIGQEESADGVL